MLRKRIRRRESGRDKIKRKNIESIGSIRDYIIIMTEEEEYEMVVKEIGKIFRQELVLNVEKTRLLSLGKREEVAGRRNGGGRRDKGSEESSILGI